MCECSGSVGAKCTTVVNISASPHSILHFNAECNKKAEQ